MLTLMNNARLGVAAQGIGIAEAALDSAVRYARERAPVRRADRGAAAHEEPARAHGHRASRAAARCSTARARWWTATARSRRRSPAAASPEAERDRVGGDPRAQRGARSGSSRRSRSTSRPRSPTTSRGTAIQVHGGLGFMAESVPGKLHADAIITTIYEGTSEIQVSFALKEVGKGALGVVFEDVRARSRGPRRAPSSRPTRTACAKGIEQVLAAGARAGGRPRLRAALRAVARREPEQRRRRRRSCSGRRTPTRRGSTSPRRGSSGAWSTSRGAPSGSARGSPELIERCARMIAQAVPV